MCVRWLRRLLRLFGRALTRFHGDMGGNIAIVAALSMTTLVAAVGGGIDLSRAVMARQQLSGIATLACQYASRPSVAQTIAPSYTGTNGAATYAAAVNAFIAQMVTIQKLPWSQTIATPFTFTQNGPANVAVSANVPTAFMKIINVSQLTVGATSHCYDTTASINQTVPNGNGNSPDLVFEGFETPNCYSFYSFCFIQPNGTKGSTLTTPTSTFPSSAGYQGSGGSSWYIMGYCLETDQVGTIRSTVPQGSFSAELDCDNGSGSAGNSSISTKTYMPAGSYELRYNYASRVDYVDYDPVYLCGSTAGDLSWANDTNASAGWKSNVLRTNQINVYLDLNTTGSAPLHTTLDGTQQLAGSNLIDMCVYSPNWVERSVRIRISTPGYYWLSFAADGSSDSYGGQIDNIRLCIETCTTTLQDNFPSTWLAANNSGVNKVLFEDTFESPTYTQDPYTSSAHAKGGNLANSYGTSGTSSSGWSSQPASGWATAPYNEVVFWMQGATQGSQYLSLQGWNGFSNSSDPLNRSISRSFILDPGYYTVSYNYISLMNFGYDFVYNGNYYPICTAAPTSGDNYNLFGMKHGYDYGNTSTLYQQYLSTNFMNAFMSNGQLVSTPVINSTLGGAPTYNNPDGTTSSSPTVPLDNGSNYATFNGSAVNPIIDACYYASGWVARSVNIKITKPGQYWLTFSALGDPLTGLGAGPGIDDVKLTALGSLYMSSPPTTSLTAIPVPAPQPGTTYTNSGAFNGFAIVADPLTPPAASP